MELIILLFITFGLPYLIFYLVDFFKGETATQIKNEHQRVYDSIEEKLETGNELTPQEKRQLEENMRLFNINCDLSYRLAYFKSQNTSVSSSKGITEITNALHKMIWFYTTTEWCNYLIAKGTRVSNNISLDDLILLQHLLVVIGTERGFNMGWIEDTNYFMLNVKWAMEWAGNKKDALIFKYTPSENLNLARFNYLKSREEYLYNQNDKTYYKMYRAFRKFYIASIQD